MFFVQFLCLFFHSRYRPIFCFYWNFTDALQFHKWYTSLSGIVCTVIIRIDRYFEIFFSFMLALHRNRCHQNMQLTQYCTWHTTTYQSYCECWVILFLPFHLSSINMRDFFRINVWLKRFNGKWLFSFHPKKSITTMSKNYLFFGARCASIFP